MGIRFLAITKETIIYRLMMRYHDLEAFLKNFKRENGRGRHAGAKGSGTSRPDQKVCPISGPCWVNCYLENMF